MLIHIHVPKCSGSSVNALVSRKFGTRAVSFDHPDIKKILQEKDNRFRDENFDCFFGHTTANLDDLFDRPVIKFSIMRDPIDRICSFFNYIHMTPAHPLHSALRERLPTLDAMADGVFEDIDHLEANWCNYFCRAYSGKAVRTVSEFAAARASILREIEDGRLVVGGQGPH
ncbi:hypothetical protein B2G71_02210 [Novosphingobium sp. PC22D]|nr:hypothetical protein B2G71_02210 [Novosphingobium sp. PC22D]